MTAAQIRRVYDRDDRILSALNKAGDFKDTVQIGRRMVDVKRAEGATCGIGRRAKTGNTAVEMGSVGHSACGL